MLSFILVFATLCTVACQAPMSLGLFRQQYWSGFPFLPPGYLEKSDIIGITDEPMKVKYVDADVQ